MAKAPLLDSLNQVLGLFTRERPELSPADVAALTENSSGTAERLLQQFAESGFLDQDPRTGLFRLGIRFAVLGELAQRSTSLQRVAHPELRALARRVGEMTALMRLSGNAAVIVATEEISQFERLSQIVGDQLPLHATAGGKVLLAWRSEDERRDLLGSEDLVAWTLRTITTRAGLESELGKTRERGYSVNVGEGLSEISSVGAPVRDRAGAVIAALTVDAPRSRATNERIRLMGKEAMVSAARISGLCGYVEPGSKPAEPAES